jgi:two-component system phosphate regulon response regulator PhoB
MRTVLVVDDDAAIREMVRLVLERNGFVVTEARGSGQAREELASRTPDIILLDWMLPGLSGYEFIRSLRNRPDLRDIPVIMLTARDREQDKIAALEAGADDYVSKPFSVKELIARIKAVLRRTAPETGETILHTAGLELDPESQRVRAGNQPLDLSPLEYQLLLFFMRNPDRVYSRLQLIDQVWGSNTYIEERTVDVHIRRLRMSLEPTGHHNLIQTVRGTGYRFSARDTT